MCENAVKMVLDSISTLWTPYHSSGHPEVHNLCPTLCLKYPWYEPHRIVPNASRCHRSLPFSFFLGEGVCPQIPLAGEGSKALCGFLMSSFFFPIQLICTKSHHHLTSIILRCTIILCFYVLQKNEIKHEKVLTKSIYTDVQMFVPMQSFSDSEI